MIIRLHSFLTVLLVLSAAPAFAQHAGHSGHSSPPAPVPSEDSGPKVTATNKVCPVMGRPVKPIRDREVVNSGTTYLICCDGCGAEMYEHRDKYLDQEGKPLNAPK
jgi:hypothetical protein